MARKVGRVAQVGYKAVLVMFALAFAARSSTSIWSRVGAAIYGAAGPDAQLEQRAHLRSLQSVADNSTSANAGPFDIMLDGLRSVYMPNDDQQIQKCGLGGVQNPDVPNGNPDPCAYVQEFCSSPTVINYMEMHFCTFASAEWASYILLFVLVVTMFIFIGVAADSFFVPCLEVISATFRLNQNVAGVTFLALGNGAGDLFSVWSAVAPPNGNASLALGQIAGAGMFVTSIVVATIAMLTSFKMTRRPFLRDVFLYMAAVTYMLVIVFDGQILLGEAISLVVVYAVYVIVVIVARIVRKKFKIYRANRLAGRMSMDGTASDESHGLISQDALALQNTGATSPRATGSVPPSPRYTTPQPELPSVPASPRYTTPQPELPSEIAAPSLTAAAAAQGLATRGTDDKPGELESGDISRSESIADTYDMDAVDVTSDDVKEVPITIVEGLFPIWYRWSESNYIRRFHLALSAPIYLVMALCIPVVDMSRGDKRWNKWVMALSILGLPMWIVIGTRNTVTSLGGVVPLFAMAAVGGVVASIFVAVFTSRKHPPKLVAIFAFLAFPASAIWLYAICNELVEILQTLGRLFNLSDVILGVTVLAWGGSLGDWVSNPTMALRGYPQMAITACFAGPLLNLLLGLGIGFTLATSEDGGSICIIGTTSLIMSFGMLLASLAFTAVFVPINDFSGGRWYGIILITFYLAFIVANVAIEFV